MIEMTAEKQAVCGHPIAQREKARRAMWCMQRAAVRRRVRRGTGDGRGAAREPTRALVWCGWSRMSAV